MALEEGRGKPLSVQTEQVNAFLEQRGPDGCTNRERIEQNQRVIRRVSTTDKTRSYEDAGPGQGSHDGVVVQDGKLIGFGIHIFNEDIYPLQSFEIYLRNCGLTGHLDLSGCGDLLFVDVYHNEIDSVDVGGDTSLQILGIQDNRISTLDVGDLISCKGIDAGKNRLASLDVSCCHELVELDINDNGFSAIDLGGCPQPHPGAGHQGQPAAPASERHGEPAEAHPVPGAPAGGAIAPGADCRRAGGGGNAVQSGLQRPVEGDRGMAADLLRLPPGGAWVPGLVRRRRRFAVQGGGLAG